MDVKPNGRDMSGIDEAHYEIHTTNMNGVGTAGLNNELILGH